MGTNGQISWPARSPDLTPLYFFLSGHVKNRTYKIPPTTREDLKNRVRNAIAEICSVQLNNVVSGTINRVRRCQQVNSGHFEHLL